MQTFDFGLSWNGNIEECFISCLKDACKKRHFSFVWISDDNIKHIIKGLENGQTHIRVLLDTEATYNKANDLYARLCYAVKDAGGSVINDPDRTKSSIDKSIMHYELVDAGINTPYSVVVRNWEPDSFKLTEEERQKLGTPFIIKPALGYGQLGVVRDARGSIKEIAGARSFDRGDNFLLQEKIVPLTLRGKRAWFRVFNVFDTIIPCWWDDQQNLYEHVFYEEFNRYRLYPLAKIVSRIADLTRMVWFSTEIAIDKKYGKVRFVAVDYVNDQCDMSAKSETSSGVPDAVVEYHAARIVEAAGEMMSEQGVNKRYTIWLKDASIYLRGLGSSPDLLRQVA
ncbi:MAG: hypothetical protein JW844_07840 [Candidatus Omnitrophica bacterium]|nr:hypothetical protein [Candidatus Omnitrophota bacterium]